MNHGPDPAGNWFVALPAAADPAALDSLLAAAPPILRRFHPDDLHLTVAFLGRLPEEPVDRVRRLVASLDLAPIDAEAIGLALLPSPRRPSAVSLSLGRGRDAAAALIAALRPESLAAAGLPADDRLPLPHVTIARPPRRPPARELRALRAWADALDPGPIPLQLGPPRLFGWSRDRTTRQFAAAEP